MVAISSDLDGVNPLISGQGRLSGDLQRRLFATLFTEQPDFADGPPSFTPELAKEWSWSQDHTVLEIQLRADALWSDGTPITATDVVWTWQRQIDPRIAWSYAESKEKILKIEALTPDRLRVTFNARYPSQLADLNEGPILPRHAWGELPPDRWQESGGWFREHLVTSGPFLLVDWKQGQRIVLRRNPRWYEPGLPRLDRVVFRVLPDKTSQLIHLRSGAVDLVEQVPPGHARRLQASPDLRLLSFWTRQYDFIAWNIRRPLFASPELRRALVMAIDRQSLVDTLWYGFARVAVGPILHSVWAFNHDLEPWPYAPDRSRAILAAHGWRDDDGDGVLERDGREFRFALLTNSGNRIRHDAAVMIQQQLSRVGIAMEVRTVEFNTLLDLSQRGEFDAQLGAWAIDTSLDLSYAFHSDSIQNGYNFGAFSDPQVDALIDAFNEAPDSAAALPILFRLQERLHRLQPYAFLWEPQRLVVINRRLHGVEPNALSTFGDLRLWWVSEPQ